ncbi:MAG TPA: ferrous iron transport protein A [Proteobacteria bacterium]|nr:ferrous iron transport protein A [Pseudomonadota bacterium]
MTLDKLKPGEEAVVKKIRERGVVGQRLMALGLFPGTRIRVLRNAPLVDPLELAFDGQFLSLRHVEAAGIEVEPQ